jgi:hypothetical protein
VHSSCDNPSLKILFCTGVDRGNLAVHNMTSDNITPSYYSHKTPRSNMPGQHELSAAALKAGMGDDII